jgi:AGCS family alanine or glycine:cation symporter
MPSLLLPIESAISIISSFIWSEFFLIPLLSGVGIYLTFGLKFLPCRSIGAAIASAWESRKGSTEPGDITPFSALMTALSATIGTGNIAGVATAIYLGGPGAVFWMWVIAFFGMATKYSEAVLAVEYREISSNGKYVGGPMYYIRNGLGPSWAWLGALFAFFGMLAAFGIGNTVQAHSVANVMLQTFSVPLLTTGLIIAALTSLVIIGGVQRIASFASRVVPLMAIIYICMALTIIGMHANAIPQAFKLIIGSAFNLDSGAGATLWLAMRWGFARGIFSNEAGLGSAAIAHAAAKNSHPTEQGSIAMLGTFIDTICLCTMTALVIIVTGTWTDESVQGAATSAMAFSNGFGPIGGIMLSISLAVFAFTTIIGWSYYGERCAEYLFGIRVISYYRVFWILAIVIGATVELNLVWTIADILNGLMAIPNLIALLLLSPVVFKLALKND